MILCWPRACSIAKIAPFGRRLTESPVRLAIRVRPRSSSRGVVKAFLDDFKLLLPGPTQSRSASASTFFRQTLTAKCRSAPHMLGPDANHALAFTLDHSVGPVSHG